MRAVPFPTWRGAAVTAGASVVVLVLPVRPVWALVLVNACLLAVVVLDGLRAPRPADLAVQRRLPGVVALGDEAELRWEVGNPTGRDLQVHIADELAPSLHATRRRASVEVPARGRVEASARLRPRRRGRFVPTTLTVRVEGPWGLAARQEGRQLPQELRVHPPFHSRREAELRLRRARLLEVGARSARGRGGGTEFDRLREYGVDDEFRHIDWAATARSGKPIVRQYRAERNQTVLLLLDVGRVMAGRLAWPEDVTMRTADAPRLDHAMDAAMALTTVATRMGDRVGMVAFGSRVHATVPPARSRDQLTAVTSAMYRLEPELVESDYRGAFLHTLSRFRRRGLLVLLTELSRGAVREALLPALPVIASTHVLLVGSVRDPEVLRWANGPAGDVRDAYRAAAAVRELDQRRATARRLAATGAVVIDERPGDLAPRLVDAYLEIKARGRL